MKTMKKIGLMAFAALSVVLTSCSGEDGGSGGGGSSLDTYINAKVDGKTFKTFSANGFSTGTAVKNGTFVSVSAIAKSSATSMDTQVMTIALANVTGVGTFTVNSNSNGDVLSYFDSASSLSWDTSTCEGATGTVEVTAFTDKKIEGTFTFTGKDDDNCSSQKVVTSGKFRGTFMAAGN